MFALDGERQLWLTDSLHQALQHFRDPAEPICLWADALCIDQSNDDEKAVQVAMMADIFGSAAQVLVWLGPSEPDDAITFATITADWYPPAGSVRKSDAMSSSRSDHAKQKLLHIKRQLSRTPYCQCCGEGFVLGRHSSV